jgi:hypothetical protein
VAFDQHLCPDIEAFEVPPDLASVVPAAESWDHSHGAHWRSEYWVVEQRRLGHEPDGPTSGDTDQNGIQQRIGVIRAQQYGTRLRNVIRTSDFDMRVISLH